MSQTHSKFKVFICTPVDGKLDPKTIEDAQTFFLARRESLSPKSLGIEYIEDTHQLVMSIGYGIETGLDQQHPPIKISCVSLGKLVMQTAVIEDAMEEAASKVKNVICHEFYVDEGESFMVLLSLG